MTALARRSVCVLALTMVGCGASKQSAPASAPGGESLKAPDSMQEPESERKGYGEEPERPSPGGFGYAEPPPSSLGDAESTLERGWKDLANALSTAKDCEVARKALDSMKRSADRICELNRPGDPGERCAKARERVDAASDNVRRGCGS